MSKLVVAGVCGVVYRSGVPAARWGRSCWGRGLWGGRTPGGEPRGRRANAVCWSWKPNERKGSVEGDKHTQSLPQRSPYLSWSPSRWSSCWVMAATSSQPDSRVPHRSNHRTSDHRRQGVTEHDLHQPSHPDKLVFIYIFIYIWHISCFFYLYLLSFFLSSPFCLLLLLDVLVWFSVVDLHSE